MSLAKVMEAVGLKKYSSTMKLNTLEEQGLLGTNGQTGAKAMYFLTTKGRQRVFDYLEYTRQTTYNPE